MVIPIMGLQEACRCLVWYRAEIPINDVAGGGKDEIRDPETEAFGRLTECLYRANTCMSFDCFHTNKRCDRSKYPVDEACDASIVGPVTQCS